MVWVPNISVEHNAPEKLLLESNLRTLVLKADAETTELNEYSTVTLVCSTMLKYVSERKS